MNSKANYNLILVFLLKTLCIPLNIETFFRAWLKKKDYYIFTWHCSYILKAKLELDMQIPFGCEFWRGQLVSNCFRGRGVVVTFLKLISSNLVCKPHLGSNFGVNFPLPHPNMQTQIRNKFIVFKSLPKVS